MKQTNSGEKSKLWPAGLCGVLSVFCVFILIPRMRSPRVIGFSVPDPIWISLMIVTPVAIAIYLLEQKAHIPARYVWLGTLVQFLILIVFAGPISKLSPLASDEWTYIGAVLVWPLGVTAAQFVSLIALRAWKAKRTK